MKYGKSGGKFSVLWYFVIRFKYFLSTFGVLAGLLKAAAVDK